MELTGKILEIHAEKVISPKFRKRSMILEVPDDRFPQTFDVEFVQDRGALLDGCRVGQQVTVSINLKSRKWTPKNGGDDRYFTSVQGWRIQEASASGGGGGGNRGGGGGYPAPSSDDDIPF